jgi:HK97 gp10 family phage protein
VSKNLHIEGMEDLMATLKTVLPREARNITRRTVVKIAAEVRNDIRQNAPKDTGELKKSIKSKRDRGKPDFASASVNVIPKEQSPAFYWRFLEYGTKNMPAQPFILPVVEQWKGKINEVYRQEFSVQFEKEMSKRVKK